MKNFSVRKLALTLGLAFCTVTTSFASTGADDKTSVWKVSNGEDTVYVGGTIHILPISEFKSLFSTIEFLTYVINSFFAIKNKLVKHWVRDILACPTSVRSAWIFRGRYPRP